MRILFVWLTAIAAVTPPVPTVTTPANYPEALLAERVAGQVELSVTVLADGNVGEVAVVSADRPEMAAAAIEAVLKWKFTPAMRDGVAIAARIRVPFRFEAPVVEEVEAASEQSGGDGREPIADDRLPITDGRQPIADDRLPITDGRQPIADSRSPIADDDQVIDVSVRGKRRPPQRAVSDFVLDHDILNAMPRQNAADLLGSAPGVYVSRPEGDAVAQEIFLRGFDASHGQDIELSVGVVPLNQPSHIHGQGYADTNFVIPEVVRSLRVTEGVYDPRQGDFAVAGSVGFDLGVAKRGILSRTSYGSFDTKRQVLVWAPEGEADETFGAVALRETDGFGMNRGSRSGSGIAQYMLRLGQNTTLLMHVAAYGARANLAGVLRRDDVNEGRVGFYDSYPDPTANAQSALTSRAQASATLEHTGENGARTQLSLWLMQANYRSRQNFTGYLQRSQQNPTWVGRGDLIEQANDDFGLGAQASHRTQTRTLVGELSGSLEVGLAFRTDGIHQQQNLLQAPENQTWDRRVDAKIRGSDLGAYADATLTYSTWLTARAGVRADVLYYDVDDALGNFIPTFQRATFIPGFRRTALGIASGPRATLEARPVRGLRLIASYGEGYRSPQARQLTEGENAPYAKVHGMELGAAYQPPGAEWLNASVALYRTTLSQDLAFDAAEGALERIGPTTRKGAVAHLIAQPWSWALASLSVTYVHATLDAPPAASAENPTPAFTKGELLPYVPPLVVRGDASIQRPIVDIAESPLGYRVGSGFTFLSKRPLPYAQFGQTVALWDASAALNWRFVELGCEVYNLLDRQYAASEYSFVSDWGNREVPSRVPARHFSAGAPRTVFGTLTLSF